jgi:hypothetical protein
MIISPEDEALLHESFWRLESLVDQAKRTSDLQGKRALLSKVWSATHQGHQLINDIEQRTRDAALSRLEHV